ncbi:MAG: hypothetical protein R2684_16720 [Pyrinomonadaceae bacterium]
MQTLPRFEDASALETPETSTLKEYSKPELTVYGGIAELVQANGGSGGDGNPLPPVSLT